MLFHDKSETFLPLLCKQFQMHLNPPKHVMQNNIRTLQGSISPIYYSRDHPKLLLSVCVEEIATRFQGKQQPVGITKAIYGGSS